MPWLLGGHLGATNAGRGCDEPSGVRPGCGRQLLTPRSRARSLSEVLRSFIKGDYKLDVPARIAYGGHGLAVPCPVPYFVIEAMMRVHPDIRKCVVYVGLEAAGGFVPLGTGFIVAIPFTNTHAFMYLATAKHVIDDLKGDTLWMRLNRLSGIAESIALSRHRMITHPTRHDDIALFGLPWLGIDIYDYRALILSRERLQTGRSEVWDIGVGDEVVAMGLYTSHYGVTKNIPVTRIGNIALLPEEPVRIPGGHYVDAYLIELRTIAGLSGSPVFVNTPTVQVRDGRLKYVKDGISDALNPLGVLVAYHVVESAEDQVSVPRYQGQDDATTIRDSVDQRNTGFGVVIPIEHILDIVEHPEFQEKTRAKYDAEIKEIEKRGGVRYINAR
jgi:hypothetical protein